MKFFAGIIMGLCLWSCQDVKRPEKPENLIPEDKMVDILTETYLINAARSLDKVTILQNKIKLDSFVYRKFEIDSLQFAASNAFYTSDLNSYNDLFLRVQERMNLIKMRVDSIKEIIVKEEEEKRVLDSIDAVKKDSLDLRAKTDTILKKLELQLIDPASNNEI